MRERFGLKRRADCGFTLNELAIVLGAVAMVLGGIWAVAGNVRTKQAAGDAVTMLQVVKSNLLDMRKGQPFSSTGEITSALISAKVIPTNFISATSATQAVTPWGKPFRVYATAARTVRIVFSNVPSKGACITMLLQGTLCEAGKMGCPTSVAVKDGAETEAPNPMPGTGTAPGGWRVMTPENAATLCNFNSYSGSTNTVEFYYSL